MEKKIILFLAAVSIILLDRVTKLLFFEDSVRNTGALFGLFKDSISIIILLSVVALGLLVYFYFYHSDLGVKIAIVVIGSGVLGNLIDRLTYGYTVDFITLGVWPAFNVADASIVLGVIFLIYNVVKRGW